jgi:hypothetical protein
MNARKSTGDTEKFVIAPEITRLIFIILTLMPHFDPLAFPECLTSSTGSGKKRRNATEAACHTICHDTLTRVSVFS